MPFGLAVIGPPGSGKSTFTLAAAAALRAAGRPLCVVNLDPANDAVPYESDVDLADLVSLDRVQAETGLGPNGGLVYCFEFLKSNLDWLDVRPLRCLCSPNTQFMGHFWLFQLLF